MKNIRQRRILGISIALVVGTLGLTSISPASAVSLHPDMQNAEGAVEVVEDQAKSLAPLDTSAVVNIDLPDADEAVLAVDTRPTDSLRSNTSDLDPGALVVVADSVDLPAKAPLGTVFIGIDTPSDDRTQLPSGEVVLRRKLKRFHPTSFVLLVPGSRSSRLSSLRNHQLNLPTRLGSPRAHKSTRRVVEP